MNARRAALVFLLAASAGAFVLALRAGALADARDAQARALVDLDRVDADLRELLALREQREIVAAAKRPTQDVIAQVNTVLRDAGIPTDRMRSLEPEADQKLAGRYRSQSIRFALEKLSLRDLGAFLARWREARTVWTPRSIELNHVAAQDGTSAGMDARIVITATYLSDDTTEPSR